MRRRDHGEETAGTLPHSSPAGYLGGYNWRATALGCLLLVVVNFIATQYIAAKF
jgi:hypothetical protein